MMREDRRASDDGSTACWRYSSSILMVLISAMIQSSCS